MRAVDLIQKKKDGFEHTQAEIEFLVENYTKGKIEDYEFKATFQGRFHRNSYNL